MSTVELVERNSGLFRTLGKALNIATDDFLRTTQERHHQAMQALWSRLRPGDLWQPLSALNREIEEVRPWEIEDGLEAHLDRWLGQLHRVAHWLKPFLPTAADRIEAALAGSDVGVVRNLFPRAK